MVVNESDPSQQQKDLNSKLRTGNMMITSNAMNPLMAERESDAWINQNAGARTGQYIGFDRQSHDPD